MQKKKKQENQDSKFKNLRKIFERTEQKQKTCSERKLWSQLEKVGEIKKDNSLKFQSCPLLVEDTEQKSNHLKEDLLRFDW